MNTSLDYAELIMRDETDEVVSETPTIYEDDKIERVYEFRDGAVVRYEWQSKRPATAAAGQNFNHRFSLIQAPQPNPSNLRPGTIKTIFYP